MDGTCEREGMRLGVLAGGWDVYGEIGVIFATLNMFSFMIFKSLLQFDL